MKMTKYIFGFLIIFMIITFTDINLGLNQKENYKKMELTYTDIFTMTPKIFPKDIENNCDKFSFKVLSTQEMVTLLGGCSGSGTCQDYPHTCPSGCSYFNARKCYGTVGDCVNDWWVLLCRCGSSYYYTSGCY